jgi:hypothetical protein
VADVKKLLAVSKRRVPEGLPAPYLQSMEFARVWIGKPADDAQVFALGAELEKVARLYIRGREVEARKKAKVGRPQHMADKAFIHAMARLWEGLWGRPKFRRYQKPRVKKEERGGKEAPTAFQHVCDAWMRNIDPDRPCSLGAAAFKNISKRFGDKQ